MPKREIEDPIATILRGTGAPQNSEPESHPRPATSPAAPLPAPVTMPRQTMNLKLGGGPKRGGKMIATLAAVLLIGALGAAAWFFQEPIKEMAEHLFPKKAADAPNSPSIPAAGDSSATVAADASAPQTPGGTAPFDPLSKPAPGLKGEDPTTGIGPNAVVGTNLPVPPNPGTPADSTSPPPANSEEIKPPSAPDAAASMAPLLAAPKATVVEEGADSPAPQTAQHVPGTALGKKGGGADSLIEVTPSNPVVPAPASGGHKPATAPDAKKEVVVQVTPEAKRAADALQAFFAAGNLSERMPLTLGAANMKSLMERYYAKKDSGPIEVSEIKLLRHDPSPGTGGGAHCVFTVASKLWEYPIPVMLQEEGGAYKVDWLAFVEFRDNLLFEFLSDYQEMPARFHVGIRRTHYFEDDVPDLDGKDCFEIQPPLPSYVGYVFLPKESPLAADLASRISWETLTAYVIVELRWKRLGPMKWVELTGVPQLNWYSFPQPAQSDSSLESKASPAKKSAGGVDVKQRIPTGPPQK